MKKFVIWVVILVAICAIADCAQAAALNEIVQGAVKTVDGAFQTAMGAIGRVCMLPIDAVRYALDSFFNSAVS